MQLFAYNQIGRAHELLVWVGLLGEAVPPVVTFEIAHQLVAGQLLAPGFEPLGDQPLNQRAIFSLPWPATQERFTVLVRAGAESVSFTSKKLPQNLPAKHLPSFNLLLSSCYYQPNDKAQALGSLLKSIKPAPDFTLLAGDQVYLDLPSLQDLPFDKQQLAQILEKKYQANWFSESVQQPGLANMLSHGPVLCVPDDHEFWNNFPLFQVQLDNTHHKNDRDNWLELANRLYERYQRSPTQAAGFFRQDIAPLSMLFLDGRTTRDAGGKHMFNAQTAAAIVQWKADLLARKQQQLPSVGLLSSGQALLIETPGYWDRRVADMEMVNYEDFALLKHALEELFAAEVPVIYITGDVHWGRVVEGRNLRGNILFYEVIASPSRLIDTLGSDQINSVKNRWRNWFGESRPFPKHPEVQAVNEIKIANLQFNILHRQQGDHVALLRFNETSGGLEFYVDYICTDANEKKRRDYSVSCGPYTLKSL